MTAAYPAPPQRQLYSRELLVRLKKDALEKMVWAQKKKWLPRYAAEQRALYEKFQQALDKLDSK